MVQRPEGLRLHSARRGRQRRLRPLLGDPDVSEAFDIARGAYARGALDLARLNLRILLATCPEDGPGRFYVERCETRLAGRPLPDADGCVVLEAK